MQLSLVDSNPTEFSFLEECAIVTNTIEASCIGLRDDVEVRTEKIDSLAADEH